MKSEKSQGRRRNGVLIGATALAVVAFGAALFLWSERAPRRVDWTSPATSTLRPLLDRCDAEPSVEIVEGLTRATCTAREHPVFMIFYDADDGALARVGLMVPMDARPEELAERIPVGYEMFSLVAGAPAESFLPPIFRNDVGVRDTSFTRDGWVYAAKPMGNVGLVFSVMPEG
jgi:flagellar biosynthesis/type III secretory pathway M-ring protein FliF/YscJ